MSKNDVIANMLAHTVASAVTNLLSDAVTQVLKQPEGAKPTVARVAREDNTELLEQSGLRIVHVRGEQRDVTVAFHHQRGSDTIKIATSVCHPIDTFAKKRGTRLAIQNFQDGKVVTVPLYAGYSPVQTLQEMFG